MGDHAFSFTEFDFQKKHPYTVFFIGSCTQMNGEVCIEYTGAEAKSKSSIPDEWLDDLKEKLNEDYGYGPFDKTRLKHIFNEHKSYIF